jgi:hypothetical protein
MIVRRLRPSFATCIALLALFISLGGTTYAVTSLPRESVGTTQLRERAVTEDKLATDAVVTRKLANGAVRAPKIARGAVTGSRIASNTIGGEQVDESALATVPSAQEAEHAKVATRAGVADRVERIDQVAHADASDRAALADRATHADHAERTDRTEVADSLDTVDVNYEALQIAASGSVELDVDCDLGLTPVGGGYLRTNPADATLLVGSGPMNSSWVLAVRNESSSTPAGGYAYVICIRAGQT